MNSAQSSGKDARQSQKEGYVAVTGGRVWYGIAGSEKPGVPLLVLHGGPGAPHDYLEPLEDLSESGSLRPSPQHLALD